MEWTTFLFGALAGSITTVGLFVALAWRWMRPFMQIARRRATQSPTVSPPINWGSDEEEKVVWPPTKKQGGKRGH